MTKKRGSFDCCADHILVGSANAQEAEYLVLLEDCMLVHFVLRVQSINVLLHSKRLIMECFDSPHFFN